MFPRPRPRYDPKTIYRIHADREAGTSAADIAVKHDLPAVTVQGFLRSSGKTCALLSPYELRGAELPPNAAVQIYWLGYIAASGRVFGQNNLSTLILAIHPDDVAHIQTLLADLVIGHPRCEFAESSLDGRQAYVRDRSLAEVLLQWGIGTSTEDGSIPIEFIPSALWPDFVRGYLEGSRRCPPFGGQGTRAPRVPGVPRTLTLVGNKPLVEGLSRELQSACGITGGTVAPSGAGGLSQVTFSPSDTTRILQTAYRSPTRTSPRAAKFVKQFAHPEGRRRRNPSK
jgi:hypothetical protein